MGLTRPGHTTHDTPHTTHPVQGLLLRGPGEGEVLLCIVPGPPCTYSTGSSTRTVPGYTAQQSTAGTTAVVPQRYT